MHQFSGYDIVIARLKNNLSKGGNENSKNDLQRQVVKVATVPQESTFLRGVQIAKSRNTK